MAEVQHTNGVLNGFNYDDFQGPPNAAAHEGKTNHLKDVETSLNDLPAYSKKRMRVVTIGAGYSGLTLAHKFQHQHPELRSIVDHTIYEARAELGGTWLVNTYPGVVCDVPSHIYVRRSHDHVSKLVTDHTGIPF